MAMEAHTRPSPPFSTAGLGPCELSCSFSTYHLAYGACHRWVFWSTCGNGEVHCVNPRRTATSKYRRSSFNKGKEFQWPSNSFSAIDGAVIKDKILRLLELLFDALPPECLVQFWDLVTIGDKMYLTACDQPFAFKYFTHRDVKKLCEYRKHCLDYLIPVNDDDQVQLIIGPPGRVFRSGLPEYAWDVRDYTAREYPQRDYAVGRVMGYWTLPIYHHPTWHLPSGVLEIVSTDDSCIHRSYVLKKLQNLPWEVNLTSDNYLYKIRGIKFTYSSAGQDGEIAKIAEALSEVTAICGLDDTETWITSGEILSSHPGVDFIRKGQGVVGKAFSSKSACFCRDIKQLSITEYPLVPIARRYKYSACFAVCLQSSCLNNCIYILEFFLPMNKKNYRDPRTLLHSLMETLKERLQNSFKIASGQELGQKLTVEVIKVSPKDEFDSFEICNTTGVESTPRLREVHGGEGMMQLDFSSQQVDTANAYINGVHGQQGVILGSPPRSERAQGFVNISYLELNLVGADVVHNSMNGIYEQQNGIVTSSTGQVILQNMVSIADHEPIVEDPERDDASIEQRGNEVTNLKMQEPSCTLKSDLGITREVLEQNSTRKLEEAAKNIRVSRSTLKRICREYGIRRWPPRKERKVNQVFAKQKVVQPATENIEEHHQLDATRLEDDSSMWVIKAKYQEDKIKFELPSSAPKIDLEKNIAQRFNLSLGSFKIKYQDELNDWILITCDTDLSFCMKTLHKLGRTTIEMLVS